VVGEDVDDPTTLEGEMFVAQIIQELEMERSNNAQTFLQNIPEFGLDALPYLMQPDCTLQSSNIPCFPDMPPILMDDNDSICYPCATVEEHAMDNLSEQLEEETDKNKKSKKKAKHCLWHMLVGNVILDRTQLQQKLVTNLLCFQCMQEQLEEANRMEEICLNDAMIVAMTRNVGFACTLSVKCVHGCHQFTVEPLHAPLAVTTHTQATAQDGIDNVQ